MPDDRNRKEKDGIYSSNNSEKIGGDEMRQVEKKKKDRGRKERMNEEDKKNFDDGKVNFKQKRITRTHR